MAIMENQAQTTGDLASDIELSGVNLERRGRAEALAMRLLQAGLSTPEVEDAVRQFFENSGWPVSMSDPVFITDTARIKLLKAEVAQGSAEEPDELLVVELADVTPEPVRWLWAGKIPLGRVTAIYGEAGHGKTWVGLDLAARVSAGKNWPDGVKSSGAGQALLVNGLDPLKTSVSPRLLGAGANPQNISTIAAVKSGGVERRVDLGRDLPLLRQRIESLGRVQLVVIDCLETCCGNGHVSKGRMRSMLLDLEQLAAEYGVAVVVISAGNKSDLLVKNIWRVDCEVLDPDQRCLVPVRFHEGPLPSSIPFRIKGTEIIWGDPYDAPSEDQLQGANPKQERCRQLRAQMDWLKRKLLDGPVPAKDMLAGGKAAGWSASQVKRAKHALNVLCYKEEKPNGRWIWELPLQNWTGSAIGKVHVFGTGPTEVHEPSEWFKQKQKELRELGQRVEWSEKGEG